MTRHLVLGVIGHVDHGKTALVRALTGTDTDRLVEEKQRGISIALGFAHLSIAADTDIDLIDMPGHERFVRTMISGATGMDAVLLVVAANEGIKRQTREHVDIAALLGLRSAVIAITKTDLVTQEEARQVANESARLLDRSGLIPLAPIMTSALHGTGIDELRQALRNLSGSQSVRSVDGLAFLPIDRAFSVVGHGPVVTGTLRGASIKKDDTLELLPLRRSIRVRSVQVHAVNVTTALPGQRVALNLRDVEIDELQRGMSLAAAETLTLSEWLTISIRAVENAPPLKNGKRLRALLGTQELDVRLRLLDRDVLEAGQQGFAQLHCSESVAIPASEHVILRLASPPQTVAGGKILEPETRRQRRNSPQILQRLKDLHTLPAAAMMAAEIYRAGAMGTTLQTLSRLSSLATQTIAAQLKLLPIVITKADLVVRKADMDNLLAGIPAALAKQAAGLSRTKLIAALPGTGSAVMDEALAQLQSRGLVIERNKLWLLPRPDEDRARANNEIERAAQIAQMLQRAGLTPPNPGDIVIDAQSKRAVDRLLRERVIVRAVDRAKGKELLFHRDAIADAQRQLARLLERPPGLLVTEIAAALGISRKYCMPLLDHLDTIRFTLRLNERRVLTDSKVRTGRAS